MQLNTGPFWQGDLFVNLTQIVKTNNPTNQPNKQTEQNLAGAASSGKKISFVLKTTFGPEKETF